MLVQLVEVEDAISCKSRILSHSYGVVLSLLILSWVVKSDGFSGIAFLSSGAPKVSGFIS